MLFKCYGNNFIEVRIYIYICKVIISFVGKFKCECKEKWGKRECDFSSLVFHVSHPNCPLSLSDFAAPKVFSLSYFPRCIRPESPALFSYSFFFVFAFFSLCSYTAAFPLSPKQNIPL